MGTMNDTKTPEEPPEIDLLQASPAKDSKTMMFDHRSFIIGYAVPLDEMR